MNERGRRSLGGLAIPSYIISYMYTSLVLRIILLVEHSGSIYDTWYQYDIIERYLYHSSKNGAMNGDFTKATPCLLCYCVPGVISKTLRIDRTEAKRAQKLRHYSEHFSKVSYRPTYDMWHAVREEDWFTVAVVLVKGVMSDVISVVRDDPYDPSIKVQMVARHARSVLRLWYADMLACWLEHYVILKLQLLRARTT